MTEPPVDPSNVVPGPGYLGSSSVPPGPPSDGGIEALYARVGAIEDKLDELNRKTERVDDRLRQSEIALAGLDGKLSGIDKKVDLLATQIVGKLPSWWQLPVVVVGLVSFLALLVGVAQRLHMLPS